MTMMQVRKRDGDLEPVDVNKIVRAVERAADAVARSLEHPGSGGVCQ